MATYTFSDNDDGTGITVTIAGGGASDTHIAYYQAFTGGLGASGTWTSGGTRTGNGAIALSVTDGHYLGYVESTASGVMALSTVQYLLSSTAATSVHYRCLTAVQARIIAASLSGMTAANVKVRKLPSDRGMDSDDGTYSYPAVIVSSMGIENQQAGSGTNIRDDVDYPVIVSILAADNQDLYTNHEKYLKWREQINRAFRQQRLSGVTEVHRCLVQPGPITSPAAFWNNVYHSSLVIRCFSREIRGI